MMAKQYDLLLKFLLIGDSGVGKTCMICRFADETFSLKHDSTIGIDFMMKTIQTKGKRIRLQLWDTAGQEKYDTLTRQYYRRAHGIVLAYDITNPRTFTNLDKWINCIHEYAQESVVVMLLANKTDMEAGSRRVSRQQGEQLAARLTVPFYEVSAKNAANINEAFMTMSGLVMDQYKEEFDRIHLERQDSDSEFISELNRDSESVKCQDPCCT